MRKRKIESYIIAAAVAALSPVSERERQQNSTHRKKPPGSSQWKW